MSRMGRKMARKNARATNRLTSQAERFEHRRQNRIKNINAREYAERLHESREIARGTLSMLVVACNKTEGLGKERLEKLLRKIGTYQESLLSKMVTVDDIEQILHQEANVKIAPNGNSQWQTIRKISAMFMLALHDLYGFGEKRLARVYNYAVDLSKKINRHEISGADIAETMKKIGLLC